MNSRRTWTREELIVAFNLYCKVPFSKINSKNKLIIELSSALNRTPSAVAWKLANFASLDPSLKSRNIKGAMNCSKLDRLVFDEFYQNWDALVGESEDIIVNKFKIQDSEKLFQYRDGKVKAQVINVRLNQSFFRKAILASYNSRCCITGLNIPELLIASHIVPWSIDEKNRLNPENGLCLNSIHDRAFDCGLITIDLDYKVKLSQYLYDFETDPAFQKFFKAYEHKTIEIPKKFLPKKEFLEFHQNNIFKL